MKKVWTVIVISFVLIVGISMVQSCNPCNVEAVHFQTQAISGSVGRIVGIDTSGCCDNYLTEPFIPGTSSVRYDSLLLIVQSEIQTVYNESNVNFNFGISTAMACSPARYYDVFKEVEIFSDQPYSDVFPAGSSLNDVVSVSWDARILDSQINNLMINREDRYGKYYFKFNVPPDTVRVHNITIEYIFTDGRVLRSVISGLKIGN